MDDRAACFFAAGFCARGFLVPTHDAPGADHRRRARTIPAAPVAVS